MRGGGGVVSKTQVDLLVTAAIQWGDHRGFLYHVEDPQRGGSTHRVTAETATRTGAMLLRTASNAASASGEAPSDYRFEPLVGDAHAPLVLGCIAGFEQVCVGHGSWHGSEAEAFIAYLRSTAATLLDLPEVPWGLRDADRDIWMGRDPTGPGAER